MDTYNSRVQALTITLPAQPLQDEELEAAIRRAGTGPAQHVIVDFAQVEIMSSATICNLIILERLLSGMDRQLVLCALPPKIMGIFRRVGLQGLFVFAEDACAAGQWLQDRVGSCR